MRISGLKKARLVIIGVTLFILCRCATKHQGIAFDPYFPIAPEELFTSTVMGEIQSLELKDSLSVLEKKRLVDLYLIELRSLKPENDRQKRISDRSENYRFELEPLMKRVSELRSELLSQQVIEAEQKGFENPRLKKAYSQAYQAWNRDENEKAFAAVDQILASPELKALASKTDWTKIINLKFRVAMDLGLLPKVTEGYAVLKSHDACSPETTQAGFIVSLLYFSEGKREEASEIFKAQCDKDDSLSNRLKRAYWKFRFQKEGSPESEVAQRELLQMPMPGYYAYLTHLLKNQKMSVLGASRKPRYLEDELSVSKEVHELFQQAETALQSNLRRDAGLYVGKAVLALKGNPDKNLLSLLYAAHLFRASGLHLESMKVFTFLIGNDKKLSKEELLVVQEDLPEVYPKPFGGIVDSVGKSWHVDPDFVYSIMRQESAFNPAAVSTADARGLMQMMPALARALSGQWKSQKLFQDRVLFSAGENVKLAVYHLHQLETWGPHFALMAAAYNAGASRVMRWWTRFGHLPLDVFVELIPIGETRNYVKLVLRNYLYYKALRTGGEVEPGLFSLSLPAMNGRESPRL